MGCTSPYVPVAPGSAKLTAVELGSDFLLNAVCMDDNRPVMCPYVGHSEVLFRFSEKVQPLGRQVLCNGCACPLENLFCLSKPTVATHSVKISQQRCWLCLFLLV